MRILHTSDWHLGKSLYEFSLLADQRCMIDFLLRTIADEKIDAVLICGDIYDRSVPPSGAVELYDYFLAKAVAEMGVAVLAIAGNHDSPSRVQFGSALYKNSGYHVSGAVRRKPDTAVLRDEYGDICFTLLPYLHPADVRECFPEADFTGFDGAYRTMLDELRPELDPAARNIILAHGFFAAVGGDEPLLSGSEIAAGGIELADASCFRGFDYAALGHLHGAQKIGDGHIRYSGTPLKYSLSEEGRRKCFLLLDVREKGSIEISEIPVPPLHDVRTVSGSFSALMDPLYHENKCFDDYIFANITGDLVPYPMEKLRTLMPNLLGLSFTELAAAEAVLPQVGGRDRKLDALELFRRFYRDMRDAELPPDRAAVLAEAQSQAMAQSEQGREGA